MYKLLAALVVLASVSAQAAPLNISGYSCDNREALQADIDSLEDLHTNFKTNSFVQGQILKEFTSARREQQMLNVICKSEDDGPYVVIVEDYSKEY